MTIGLYRQINQTATSIHAHVPVQCHVL